MSLTQLFCPYCDDALEVPFDHVIEGESLECSKKHKFNVFTIYRSFYQDITIAKRIADFLARCVYGEYKVQGNHNDVDAIEVSFENQNFKKLFKSVVTDTIIYGNSLVLADHKAGKLERYDLADTEVKLGYGVGKGTALQQRFEHISTMQGVLNITDIIHFKHNGSGLLGQSIYGGWFQNFYSVKLAPKALVNASIMKKLGIDTYGLDTVDGIRNHFQREILSGAGAPQILLSKALDELSELEFVTACRELKVDITHRREELQDTIERSLFPFILDRAGEVENYPKFLIIGPC